MSPVCRAVLAGFSFTVNVTVLKSLLLQMADDDDDDGVVADDYPWPLS